jgi:hypothetical protein
VESILTAAGAVVAAAVVEVMVVQVVLQMVWEIAQISTHQCKDLMQRQEVVVAEEQEAQTDLM